MGAVAVLPPQPLPAQQLYQPQYQQYYPMPPQHTQYYPPPPNYYPVDWDAYRRREDEPPSTTSNSSKEKPKTKNCMYLHYDHEDHNLITVTGLIKTNTNPGGGTKVIVTSSIYVNNCLIPVRIWVNNGSQITMIAKIFVETWQIPTRKGPQYKLMGFGGNAESGNDICDLIVIINNNKVLIPALVSNSSLLNEIDILLGADQLGKNKKLAFFMPTDKEPFLVLDKTSEIAEIASVKSRIPEFKQVHFAE